MNKLDETKSLSISRAKSVPRTSKPVMSHTLTDEENKLLKERIKQFKEELKTKVALSYPDNYMASNLIDERLTKEKNAIVRRIKFHQRKEQKLPEFIRKEKENILAARAEPSQLGYSNFMQTMASVTNSKKKPN